MKKYDIGFIGYGNMARAIVTALSSDLSKSLLSREGFRIRIAVTDIDREKLTSLPKGVVAAPSAAALVSDCDVIFVAVKPQSAVEALSGLDFGGKIVVSIMASVTLAALKKLTGAEKLVRVMPNLNARIGAAYSSFAAEGLSGDEKNLVGALLTKFGEAREMDESLLNAATGLAGSGPAFVFKFIDGFVQNAEKNGFSREAALEMSLATIRGSVALVDSGADSGNVDIGALVRSVCSKGGTTIEGVNYLDEHDFEKVVSGAVDKAIARAEEMSKAYEER